MANYRLVFAGTPGFAADHLSTLIDSGHDIVGVFTQPDRPAGRGRKSLPSPVKQSAVAQGLAVYQPESLRAEEQHILLRELRPDLLIVVAYGLMLPKEVLDIPKFGCLNVHASLLPRWRGAAPIERALLSGDKVTGITIMLMDEGLDTGDILYQSEVPITDSDTRIDLEEKLSRCGRKALRHCLDSLPALLASSTGQDDALSTYAAKLEKAESMVQWNRSAQQIHRLIRAGIGRAPAFSIMDGERLRLLHATPSDATTEVAPGTIAATDKDSFTVACRESLLIVDRVQLPGKSPMAVRDLNNSKPDLFKRGKSFSAESGHP